MEISLLIEDEETKADLEKQTLSMSVASRAEVYHADGGNLFIYSFSAEGDTLNDARTVSGIWDVISDLKYHILRDDASALFGEMLYPLLSKFERGLRSALIVRACANHENVKDISIEDIEQKSTLASLAKDLLVDKDFASAVKNIVNNNKSATKRSFGNPC